MVFIRYLLHVTDFHFFQFLHPGLVAGRIVPSHQSQAEKAEENRKSSRTLKCFLWFCMLWVSRENVSKRGHISEFLLQARIIHNGFLRAENHDWYLVWQTMLGISEMAMYVTKQVAWAVMWIQLVYLSRLVDPLPHPVIGRRAQRELGEISCK